MPPPAYTHNLKIVFVDTSGNIVEDESYMDEIKKIFCEPQSHIISWTLMRGIYTILWTRKKLDKLQSHVMGDLFSCPIYEKDSIILIHTQKTINSIPNPKYKIHFHISRVAGDKQIIPDFIGFIP
jgi:hypothetical protein